MSDMPQRAPRKKHYLDDYKLRLSAEPLSGGKGRPSLCATVVNNNPRIDVYTNKPDDKNRGQITAKMDAPTMYVLLELIKSLFDAPPKTQYAIKNLRPGENKEKIHDTTTVVGKDDQGRIYIAVLSADPERPKVNFLFGMAHYHTLAAGNGVKLTEGEISVFAARAWCNLIKELMINVMTDNYTEPPPRENKYGNKGGGGGNNNWKNRQGGGGGSNWQQRPQRQEPETETAFGDFDDLPM